MNKHGVTHKGWDCKDDLKLFKYDDTGHIKSSALNVVFSWTLFYDLAKEETSYR